MGLDYLQVFFRVARCYKSRAMSGQFKLVVEVSQIYGNIAGFGNREESFLPVGCLLACTFRGYGQVHLIRLIQSFYAVHGHIASLAAVHGDCSHSLEQPAQRPEEELFLYHYVGKYSDGCAVSPGNYEIHDRSVRNPKEYAFAVLDGFFLGCLPAHQLQYPFAEFLSAAHLKNPCLVVKLS